MTDAQRERRKQKDRNWYARNRDRKLEYCRKWRSANKDRAIANCRKWYAKNRDEHIKERKLYQLANPEIVRRCNANYYRKHSEQIKAYQVAYDKANRKKINRRRRSYTKQRIKNDQQFRIMHVLRSRLCAALKGKKPIQQTINLVGLSPDKLISHIEVQFQPGMTWQNYGFRGWHIDHILPCALFDLTDPDQQRECFHYSNLQPLWWKDNLRKKRKL